MGNWLYTLLLLVNHKKFIIQKALSLGFSLCGFTKAESLESFRARYSEFTTGRDYDGMEYLERYTEQRLNPDLLLPGVKSVIALAMNYYPQEIISEEDNYVIAKYAYGKSYHKLMKERLNALTDFMEERFENKTRSFIDSAPVLEKMWAQRCGVGWQGKNTIIISPSEGSFFFIGIILTTLELKADEPETDHCGSCTRCVDGCPTGALNTPYQLDIKRCISYHTIENRGEVPEEMNGKFNDRIFGCDICQDVCPFNRFAKPTPENHFLPSPELTAFRKKEWREMDEETFKTIFRDSEILRTGFQTMKRNMNL